MRRPSHIHRSRSALVAACFAVFVTPATALAAGTGDLTVRVSGMPAVGAPALTITGPRLRSTVRTREVALHDLPAGRYTIVAHPVRLRRASGRVQAGAVAYPARLRRQVIVRAGRDRVVRVAYAGVVNPAARPLPRKVVGILGTARAPRAVLLPGDQRAPRKGTIFLSGARSLLPYGLVARVTRTARQGSWRVAWLKPVPVTDATPQVTFGGRLAMAPVRIDGKAAVAPSARPAAGCKPPPMVKFGAHLDKVELREASVGALPPQMRLTLAVRTTESLGVIAAATGINCDWTIGEIGPFQGAIPVGPVVIPVYATLPVSAGLHLNGTLNAGTINIASTTVASVAAGMSDNHASLSQQGTNVWISGSPSLAGSAKLSASIGLQAGIGIVKGANAHLQADFGPELTWSSGRTCDISMKLGALSAGLTVFGKTLNTPAFAPLKPKLWSGCDPGPAPSQPQPQPTSPTPSPSTPGPSTPAPTAPAPTTPGPAGPSTPPPPTWREQETPNHPVNTFRNYHNASGLGPAIPSGAWVDVYCKVYDPTIGSVNPDGYWYRIASPPWNGEYYSPANTFMNGDPYGGPYTHNTDFAVPNC